MKYYIAHFKNAIPQIEGMKIITCYDMYSIISLEDEQSLIFIPKDVHVEEITEIEGTVAWKFYGISRDFRKAYSDIEGLEPDADELAKGSRRTKVYITPEINDATISLMKRIFRCRIIEEFDTRESRDGEEEILEMIDSLTTIKDLNIKREELLDIEMPRVQAIEMGLWDEQTNQRIKPVNYNYGF